LGILELLRLRIPSARHFRYRTTKLNRSLDEGAPGVVGGHAKVATTVRRRWWQLEPFPFFSRRVNPRVSPMSRPELSARARAVTGWGFSFKSAPPVAEVLQRECPCSRQYYRCVSLLSIQAAEWPRHNALTRSRSFSRTRAIQHLSSIRAADECLYLVVPVFPKLFDTFPVIRANIPC
jgi:hypothetical protein